MFDTAAARRTMVDGQIRTADVTNLDLIAAMLAVPREIFVPEPLKSQAYCDNDLMLGGGRTILKPMVLAKLIQAAQIGADARVLAVGTAPGYAAAILGRLAASVVALEPEATFADRTRQELTAAGAVNLTVAVGPLVTGWPAGSPYDLILLDGATEVVPDQLGRQLAPDGRLACVFGRKPNDKAMMYRLIEGRLVGRPIFDAGAALLPGFAAEPAFVF